MPYPEEIQTPQAQANEVGGVGGTVMDATWANFINDLLVAIQTYLGLEDDPASNASGASASAKIAYLMGTIGSSFNVSFANTAPVSPVNYQVWVDTSTSPWIMKVYFGGDWGIIGASAVRIGQGPVDLDTIPAANYTLIYNIDDGWQAVPMPAPALHGPSHATGGDPVPVFGPTGGSAAPGLVPSPGAGSTTNRYLREDGSWSVPPGASGAAHTIQANGVSRPDEPVLNFKPPFTVVDTAGVSTDVDITDFVGSGASAASGLVPSPGTTAGSTRYLREDGTWQTPPGAAYPPTYTGTSTPGLVPGVPAAPTTKFLRGDGGWAVVQSGVEVSDEGAETALVTEIDFVGSGVSVVNAGGVSTVTISATAPGDHDHTNSGDGGHLNGAVVLDHMKFAEAAAPSTPPSGYVAIYAKTDGKFYRKDDAGTEAELGGGSGSGYGPYGNMATLTAPPAASSFNVWGNQGTATLNDSTGGPVLWVPASGSFNMRAVMMAHTGFFDLTAFFVILQSSGAGSADAGLLVHRSSNNNHMCLFAGATSGGSGAIAGLNRADFNAHVSNIFDYPHVDSAGIWLRIVYDSNTPGQGFRMYHSLTGLTNEWIKDFDSTAPDTIVNHSHLGFYGNNLNSREQVVKLASWSLV